MTMATLAKTKLIKIGNSKGVRIPKWMIDQVGLSNEIHIVAEEGQVAIRPARKVREGWEEAAKLMHELGEVKLLDPEFTLTEVELNEWEW